MSSVPRRNAKEHATTIDELCDLIRSGELDDDLIKLLEAINDRKDALKRKVDELVKAVYGPQAQVSDRAVQKQASAPQAVPEPDPGTPKEDPIFPEPIVSGTVYERLNSGQGVTPEILDTETVDLSGVDHVPPDLG